MPSFVRYAWDRSYSRGIGTMDEQELREYLTELRARERECERLMNDTGGMTPYQAKRQVHAMATELRQLATAIAGLESELKMREQRR